MWPPGLSLLAWPDTSIIVCSLLLSSFCRKEWTNIYIIKRVPPRSPSSNCLYPSTLPHCPGSWYMWGRSKPPTTPIVRVPVKAVSASKKRYSGAKSCVASSASSMPVNQTLKPVTGPPHSTPPRVKSSPGYTLLKTDFLVGGFQSKARALLPNVA